MAEFEYRTIITASSQQEADQKAARLAHIEGIKSIEFSPQAQSLDSNPTKTLRTVSLEDLSKLGLKIGDVNLQISIEQVMYWWRKKLGITQKDLLSKAGVDKSFLRRFVNSTQFSASTSKITAIAHALNLTTGEFLLRKLPEDIEAPNESDLKPKLLEDVKNNTNADSQEHLVINSEKLLELRSQLYKTQQALARAANIGSGHLSRLENGTRGISFSLAVRLANALNVAPEDLLLKREEPQNSNI